MHDPQQQQHEQVEQVEHHQQPVQDDGDVASAVLDDFVSRFGSGEAPPQPLPPTCVAPLGDSPLLRGFRVKGLLSAEECAYLRGNVGHEEDLQVVNTRGETSRRNMRTQVSHQGFASLLLARLDGVLPTEHLIGEGEREFGPSATGRWKRVGLNPYMRFCKYGPGGVFLPHFDGVYMKGVGERSLWTILVYLNPARKFEGGATNFLDSSAPGFTTGQAEPCPVLASVLPEEGECVLFPVDMYHEGQALTGGEKYVIRTDVMFELCDRPPLTARQERAAEALAMAREHEGRGNPEEAVACYRRAIKLDPDIEKLL
eukprot:Hpha_TRINITY_DN2399_c0_g1::TRINITY_DN2399_c0_g1_i1::g.353::m.353